ncbi:GNAT family N-acetyltransferase [Mycetocola miduiensis]|uniref:Predicted acetyltransferase n=1 Tax=Mycetocola miduiensis TaxID=995034 RepID=A0A1I5BTD4_9MICO|nr:GNAT family N-acetyltransferase [Mycetocola miduiensis]SFN77898.1 Predicted acetyltransferase [Mycetocola miduiensis]
MTSIDDAYEFRRFLPSGTDVNQETRGWLQADARGFHAKRFTETSLARVSSGLVTDGQTLAGTYARSRQEASLPAEYPVATFASFPKTLNVGGGRMLPAHLISSVTVRPTHRRRGLLRRMMTDNLAVAAAEGFAIAALTASEATIYRRFGFGPAAWTRDIEVSTDARFRLLTVPRGSCDQIEARALTDIGPRVFARFHAGQTGSVDRHVGIWHHVSGIADSDGQEDRSVRAAAHYDDEGVIDGYVSYRVTGDLRTVKLLDFVAADDNAALGLWHYLASIDLTETVTWKQGRLDEPLSWALENPRLLQVRAVEDWLWLRILDPIAALEARPYSSTGRLILRIVDSLGHASGVFQLTVTDAGATVTRDDDASPDLDLDVWVLGSLYLGGADPLSLAAGGQLVEHSPGAVCTLRALLAPDVPVYGITPF